MTKPNYPEDFFFIQAQKGTNHNAFNNPEADLAQVPSKYNAKLCPPAGLLIVDIDVKNGGSPDPFAGAIWASTPTDGWRAAYKVPEDFHHSLTTDQYPGIEFFSHLCGRSICVPPSVTEKGSYQFVDGWDWNQVQSMPPEMLEAIRKAPPKDLVSTSRVDPHLLMGALSRVPAQYFRDDNAGWLNMICAMINVSGGHPQMYDKLLYWSILDDQYAMEEKQIKKRIDSFELTNSPDVGSILFHLNKNGEGQWADYIKRDANYVEPIAAEDMEAAPIIKDDNGDQYTKHDWPVGFIGDLARALMWRMPYPNQEIAIISAFHILGSIQGRKAEFNGLKAELWNILVGPQGIGKNTARSTLRYILDWLQQECDALHAVTFAGNDGVYGVRAQHECAIRSPSMSYILPEAGLAKRSSAGDQESVHAYTMQNFTAAPQEELAVKAFAIPLPPVYGVVVAKMEESTLRTYEYNFTQESIISGDLARKLIHFVDTKVSGDYFQQVYKPQPFPEKILQGLKSIYHAATNGENFQIIKKVGKTTFQGPTLKPLESRYRIPFQAEESVHIRLAELREMSRHTRDTTEETETFEWARMARYEDKCIRIALLSAYADAMIETTQPIITWVHWKYAEDYIQECDRALVHHASKGVFDSKQEQLISDIEEVMLRGFRSDSKAATSYYGMHCSSERSQKIISHSFLLKGKSKIRATAAATINGTYHKDEINKTIMDAYRAGEDLGMWRLVPPTTPITDYRANVLEIPSGTKVLLEYLKTI